MPSEKRSSRRGFGRRSVGADRDSRNLLRNPNRLRQNGASRETYALFRAHIRQIELPSPVAASL